MITIKDGCRFTVILEERWRQVAWGPHYDRLLATKQKYDPDGLFTGHHQVGSEFWSADGFTKLG